MCQGLTSKLQPLFAAALVTIVLFGWCPSNADATKETVDDSIKKATLLNLLRVMGQTRPMEVELPIVFNRDSDLFLNYLEQRRLPRRVAYNNFGETLYREDTKGIQPAVSVRSSFHLSGAFTNDFADGGSLAAIQKDRSKYGYFSTTTISTTTTTATTIPPYTTRKTYMNLVTEQPYSVATTIRTPSTTPSLFRELSFSHPPAVALTPTQAHFPQAKEPLASYYYGPVVEPPSRNPTTPEPTSSFVHQPSSVQAVTRHLQPQQYRLRVAHTTPHPLIYGFKPVRPNPRIRPFAQRYPVQNQYPLRPPNYGRTFYRLNRPLRRPPVSKPVRFPRRSFMIKF